MFGLFGSNTPAYQGAPTSQSRGGILGFLSGLFGGGGTPPYSGTAQPYARSGWSLFASAPSYVAPQADAVLPPDTPAPPEETDGGDGNGAEDSSEVETVKRITIIVKPGPGTTVEEVVEFFNDHNSTPRA